MRILQVGKYDRGGGAAEVSWSLHREYLRRGHDAWMAVGTRRSDDERVLQLDADAPRGPWSSFWLQTERHLASLGRKVRGVTRLSRGARSLADIDRHWDRWRGHEPFRYPASHRLAAMLPAPPDIVQCHNLHVDFFDLAALEDLSRRTTVVLNLHDAWMLSGHCAYSMGCERWRTGCGRCPDLDLYPAVRRDATARNWARKKAIYSRCRLYVTTPSEWLMRLVAQSMLAPSIVSSSVINNGVDLETFGPGDKLAARRQLGIDAEVPLFLFVASPVRSNPYKDFQTLRETFHRMAERAPGKRFEVRVIGEALTTERRGAAEMSFHATVQDKAVLASYYRAAEAYVHLAHAENFSLAILEAMACAAPIVATRVGGIPEQIIDIEQGPDATGILVPPGDSSAVTTALEKLMGDPSLGRKLGTNARVRAERLYGIGRQADSLLGFFRSVQPTTRQRSA